MNTKKTARVASITLMSLVTFTALTLLYCYIDGRESFLKFRSNVGIDLHTGMRPREIESVLGKYNFKFRYYENGMRYHGIIRDVDSCFFIDEAVEIEISVDKDGDLLRYSIFKTSSLL